MKFEKFRLYNQNGIPMTIDSLLSFKRVSYFTINDIIEDNEPNLIPNKLNNLNFYYKKFVFDRETEDYVRIKLINKPKLSTECDEYLVIYKKKE